MELKNLKYFQKVADLQHITKAANELFISQPALSKVIRQLEDELGSPLFDRHGKNIDLNENGRLLLNATNEIFQILDDVKFEIKKRAKQEHTNIVVSFRSVSMLMPLLISRFQKEHLNINIALSNTFHQKEDFLPGLYCHLDSFFSPPGYDDPHTLMNEPCVLACSAVHPFAAMDKIELSDLSNEIFYYTENCHSITDLMDYIATLNGSHTLTRIECIDPETVFSFIEENLGIAFLPSISWRFTQHKGIVYREITGHTFYRHLNLEWEDDVSNIPEAIVFTEFCVEFFQKISTLATEYNLMEQNLLSLFNEHYPGL